MPERAMRRQHVRRAAEIRDVREIAHRVVADVLVHRRPDHDDRDARHHQRVAVGLGAGHRFRHRDAAAARPVLDHELLAEGLAQRLAVEPRRGVGGAAGRKRHDDAHVPGRPILRNGSCRKPERGRDGPHDDKSEKSFCKPHGYSGMNSRMKLRSGASPILCTAWITGSRQFTITGSISTSLPSRQTCWRSIGPWFSRISTRCA